MTAGTTTASTAEWTQILAKTQEIASAVVGPHAAAVDREARFPHEALAALRKERLLGAAIPRELGGLGCSLAQVATLCQTLGQHCSATAMIFAMHQIQIACMVRHGLSQRFFHDYLVEAAEKQLLVASATSEVGVGGDMRSSIAAVERASGRFSLAKNASVISYGEHADAILATARRASDAAPGDQSLVLLRAPDYQLTRTGEWDTLGVRGTCSPGFQLTGEGVEDQVLSVPFADIASQTMVPYSHTSWSACWLGIATDAMARARAFVQVDARKRPGTTPFGAHRLAEATVILQTMRASVFEAALEWDRLSAEPAGADTLSSLGYALKMNMLKVASSTMVMQIVTQALAICGMAGYANQSKFSMGRNLRDALSAQLMIANDRINATNASLLLVHKDT